MNSQNESLSAGTGAATPHERVQEKQFVEILLKLGREMSSADSAETAATILSKIADELFGWDCCNLDLYSDDYQVIYNIIAMDVVDGRRQSIPALPRNISGMALRVLKNGQELILRQGPLQFSNESIPFGDTSRPSASLLNVPIRNGQRVIGVFSIQSYSYNAYRPGDLAGLQAIADQCGGALERIKATETMRQQESKLREFAERLERSNRELESFAYVASHDLQEPLRKIRVFGDRLKSQCGPALGDKGSDYLERMQNAAQRMQNLIDNLLTYSRVTRQEQPFVPVDLNKVASEVVSDLEARIEQVGGKVEIGPLATIDAQPLLMRQLLQNLIGNALKFHRPNVPPVVKVEGRIFREEPKFTGDTSCREMFELTVSDNGIGFDEKYLSRLFQVFQRLHGRSEYEGTGLGLAITRKIAERHGGFATARSKPGEGATFIITVPTKQPKLDKPEQTAPSK